MVVVEENLGIRTDVKLAFSKGNRNETPFMGALAQSSSILEEGNPVNHLSLIAINFELAQIMAKRRLTHSRPLYNR